jgi:hypothetical protein
MHRLENPLSNRGRKYLFLNAKETICFKHRSVGRSGRFSSAYSGGMIVSDTVIFKVIFGMYFINFRYQNWTFSEDLTIDERGLCYPYVSKWNSSNCP